jgi:hypothetical protein
VIAPKALFFLYVFMCAPGCDRPKGARPITRDSEKKKKILTLSRRYTLIWMIIATRKSAHEYRTLISDVLSDGHCSIVGGIWEYKSRDGA